MKIFAFDRNVSKYSSNIEQLKRGESSHVVECEYEICHIPISQSINNQIKQRTKERSTNQQTNKQPITVMCYCRSFRLIRMLKVPLTIMVTKSAQRINLCQD